MTFKLLKPDSEDQTVERNATKVFLASSIDNGKATLWANVVEKTLEDFENLVVYNPRRDVWHAEIEQRAANEFFSGQVNWELDNLLACDIPFFYFEAGSVSPITLQELGYVCGNGRLNWRDNAPVHLPVVCCPDQFWRKGNVEIMCQRHDIPVLSSLDEAIIALKIAIEVDRSWKADDAAGRVRKGPE